MLIENIDKSSLFNYGQSVSSDSNNSIQIKEFKEPPKIDKFSVNQKEEEKKDRAVSQNEIDQAIQSLETFSNYFETHLNFSKDESTGTTVVKIVNTETDEIVRQIPSEEILKIASKMQDVIGVLFDKEY